MTVQLLGEDTGLILDQNRPLAAPWVAAPGQGGSSSRSPGLSAPGVARVREEDPLRYPTELGADRSGRLVSWRFERQSRTARRTGEGDVMTIIDAQIHVWAPDTPSRPWPPGRAAYAHGPSLSAEDVLRAMDGAGVARAVLVPPSWIGDDNTDSLAAARAHPDRFAVMGRFDPTAPDATGQLRRWLAEPGMLGIRLTFHLPPWRAWLGDGSLDWFWAAAEQAGIPLMVFVPGQAPAIGPIAARHPRLRLILDHLARGGELKDDAVFADLDQVLALARYPNVIAKVSALPCYSSERYPFPRLHTHVRRVWAAFGSRRMLWGTDYSRLPCPYTDAVRLFTEALDFLSVGDREWIMGRAAAEWIGWRI